MDGFKKMHRPSRAVDMPILQQNRHISDMAPQSPHVRFQGQLGKHLLALKDGHRYRSSVLFWADASAIGCSDYCLRDFPLAVASRVAI